MDIRVSNWLDFARWKVRASETIKSTILLVFLPVFCVSSLVTYNQYETSNTPYKRENRVGWSVLHAVHNSLLMMSTTRS